MAPSTKRATVTEIEDDNSMTPRSSRTISKSSSLNQRDMSEDVVSERSLLLPTRPLRLPPLDRRSKPVGTPRAIITIAMVGIILNSLGDQLMDSPQTRIIESIICYKYWEKVDPTKLAIGRESVGPGAVGGVAELWCKADSVQAELATLRGWQQLLDGIPSLLLAVPFGWAADRFGRKPILLAGMLSFAVRSSWIQVVCWFWQAFDIRMTWLSSLYGLLGGGSTVVTALFFVLLSDIVPESERAAVFLRVGAFGLMANLVSPPLSACLMDYNPWIPSLVGTLLELIAVAAFVFVPETLNYRHPCGSPSSSHPPSPADETALQPELAPTSEPISANFSAVLYGKLRTATSFLIQDWRVSALVMSFFAHTILLNLSQLLLQYVSKRYHLTFSKATLLLTIRAAVNVFTLFLVLPFISSWVTKHYRLSGQRKDLYLARVSALLTSVSWILVAISPNILIFIVNLVITTLGMGCMLLLRSFITSLVPAHHVARLYTLIGLVDTIGAMAGAPFLALLFKRGMSLGGTWIGLPFAFVGLMFAAITVMLCIVQVKEGEFEVVPVEAGESDTPQQ